MQTYFVVPDSAIYIYKSYVEEYQTFKSDYIFWNIKKD